MLPFVLITGTFCWQGLIEIPYILVQTIVYALITYSMINFEWTAGNCHPLNVCLRKSPLIVTVLYEVVYEFPDVMIALEMSDNVPFPCSDTQENLVKFQELNCTVSET